MSKDPLVYLGHILDSIESIQSYVQGVSKSDFKKDKKLQDAIVWRFQTIGEATKNIPKEFLDQYPDIPWSKMAQTRDKLVHFYFGIDLEIVWETIEKELPKLLEQLQELDNGQ